MCRYKNIECRHCKKPFTICKAKGRAIFGCIIAFLLIITDILLVHFCAFDLIGVTIFTVFCILICMAILPFTVRFKKYVSPEKNNKSDNIKSKDNKKHNKN